MPCAFCTPLTGSILNNPDLAVRHKPLQPRLRTIALAWLAIGLAWAPAVYLMSGQTGASAFVEATIESVCSFIPWLAITPSILRFGERTTRSAHPRRNAALLIAAGVVALPLLNFAGRVCSILAARLAGFDLPLGTAALWLKAVTITSLFALPTWLAVVALALVLANARRMAEREQALAEARLAALRAELNPHFLFNTLGSIAQLAHQSPDDAERAISSLADIMRTSLAERSRTRPLAEEIAAVRDHIELHRILIEGVTLTLDVDPAAWRLAVPTHVLIPLVENATTHGRASDDGSFTIAIAAHLAVGTLIVSVRNPVSETMRPSRGLGSGLVNLTEQLRALYGGAATIEATRTASDYVVTVTLPRAPESAA